MNGLRRYEILVPLLFNDGRPVPRPLLAQTFTELHSADQLDEQNPSSVLSNWRSVFTTLRTEDGVPKESVFSYQSKTEGVMRVTHSEICCGFR